MLNYKNFEIINRKGIFVLICLFQFSIQFSFGNRKIDSLQKVFVKTKDLKEKLDLLKTMVLGNEDPKLIQQNIDQLGIEIINSKNKDREFQYYDIKGDFISYVNREKGFKLYVKCLAYYENSKNYEIASAIAYKIARYYFYAGELQKALKFCKLADKYCVDKKQAYQSATIKMVIGVIYSNLGNNDSALIYQKQALEVKYRNKFYAGIPVSLSNISEVYMDMGDTAKARATVDECIQLTDSLKMIPELTYANCVKGTFLNRQGNYKAALNYLLKASSVWESKKAYADLQNCYNHITTAYENLKDYENAFNYHRKLSIISDTLFNIAKLKSVSDLEAKYQNEKKELEISKQKSDLKIIETQKENQLTIFILVAIFLIFNAIILYRRYIKQKKDKEIIMLQKMQLEVRNKDIEDSISYSSRVQQAIFPSMERFKESFEDSFVLFQPKEKVSGDFYWLEKKGSLVLVAAADCTGHGVPGAMVSVVCNNALNRSVKEFNLTDPGLILDNTREQVITAFSQGNTVAKDGMDISLGCFDFGSKASGKIMFKWAGANNPVWIITMVNEQYQFKEIKPNKQPIGTQTNAVAFTTHSIELQKGDIVYFFTDGYADQFGGEKGKKFKYSNLQDILLKNATATMKNQSEILLDTFDKWKGDLEQIDDVCIIGIKI